MDSFAFKVRKEVTVTFEGNLVNLKTIFSLFFTTVNMHFKLLSYITNFKSFRKLLLANNHKYKQKTATALFIFKTDANFSMLPR